VDYAKKKEKRAQIKFLKDETVQRDDQYKSHTVHVSSGEPPNSRSKPAAKRKAGVVRPITKGKLLKNSGTSKVCRIVAARYVILRVVTSAHGNPAETRNATNTRRFSSVSCGETRGLEGGLDGLTCPSSPTGSRSSPAVRA